MEVQSETTATVIGGKFLELTNLDDFLSHGKRIENAAVVGVDFREATIDWKEYAFRHVVFLGCDFQSSADVGDAVVRGGLVFPEFPDVPYDAYRQSLYTWQELAEGRQIPGQKSIDLRIYEHFLGAGRDKPAIVEALAQRVHDHAIDTALRRTIAGLRTVGIMGGHTTARTDPMYAEVAQLARGLTRAGYHVASGGGPGIMEAANLGAWMATFDDAALDTALHILAPSPTYHDVGYFERAAQVLEQFPGGSDSLAIPTWFYGHEPSNLFGTHIAKYFSNSIREDTLLAICLHGIVFAPGSAGTTQEIFQDAAQNHYAVYGEVSPMVFLGTKRYAEDTHLFKTLQQLAQGQAYAELLYLTDSADDAVSWIQAHPPAGSSEA